jgi:predicted alpha-1,2-mannosidase
MRCLFLICYWFGTVLSMHGQYAGYVNPMIGTGGHGHTFPGATQPFAMIQLSPDTRIDGSWDGCSGYHYDDSLIYGFSHTHLSGTGCSDYGDIAFMPTWVSKPVEPVWNIDTLSARFSHKTEVAKAGYYSVELNEGRIKVELTSTTRVGLQRYTYKRSGYTWITLNLKHRDELLEGKIMQIGKNRFSGLRRSKAWAEDQLLFYYFELSRDADQVKISKGPRGETKVNLGFWVKAGEKILVKTALSSVDEAGAKANMVKELPHWDFEKVKTDAFNAWEKELSKIKVYGGTEDERHNFYTALYHCMMHPNVMNDVDGRYMGRDKQVHKAEGFDYYTVFSLWDTHRALHPLLNIIDKKRSHDFIMTFKAQYEQSGRLPMWELWGNETNCMIGFHSVSVILDAYINGVISNEELKAMYPAVRAEALSNRFGLDKFREKGYLEVEDESESVSKTLEYSYDMWCVAEIARQTGNSADVGSFEQMSHAWGEMKRYRKDFARPRKNGGWLEPFDPREVNNHYTEANAWQYRFYMPHEENDGNYGNYEALFKADSISTGRVQPDITGLIGQYAHGNEPCHGYIYLLEYEEREPYLRQVMKDFYKNTPAGLCGNDDCGQMSAWYVFSSMGFYPVCPGKEAYLAGVSLFDSVHIADDTVIKDIKNRIHPHFPHKMYSHGMPDFSGAPIIQAEKTVFDDSLKISVFSKSIQTICYAVDSTWIPYTKPFYIYKNTSIRASWYYPMATMSSIMYKQTWYGKIKSAPPVEVPRIIKPPAHARFATAHFYKRPNNYSIKLSSTYNKQYSADGDQGLIDGLMGDTDWRKGRWQGYQGQDFEAVIDLQKLTPVTSISANFLQDTRAWIILPVVVRFEGSADSIHFEEIGTLYNVVPDTSMKVQTLEFTKDTINEKYRYIRVKALNYGKLPSWHPGRGEDAFIFIDEISIR